jgi:hypothetical protein
VGLAGRGVVSMGARDWGRDRGEIWNDFEEEAASLSLTGVESCFWTLHDTMSEEPTANPWVVGWVGSTCTGGAGWFGFH